MIVHAHWPTRSRPARYSCFQLSARIDRTRTLTGAACGALAAVVWALTQPLDKLVFASEYDDIEILGRLATSGDDWYPAGLALHMQIGALFGAGYANVAPLLPLPLPVRGPAVALAEHLAVWPVVRVADRSDGAVEELSALAGNRRAFAQATWRHLLFGFVLGELERRLNADRDLTAPQPEAVHSSNGYGSLEHMVSAGPTP